MIDRIKRWYSDRRHRKIRKLLLDATVEDILPEDDKEMGDVFDAIYQDDELNQDMNAALTAMIVSYNFSPNIVPFIYSLQELDLTPTELLAVMFRAGTVVQFLLSNERFALEASLHLKEYMADDVISRVEARLKDMAAKEGQDNIVDELGIKKRTHKHNPDELANKLIENYLKSKRKDGSTGDKGDSRESGDTKED